jgi:hypothetical protein
LHFGSREFVIGDRLDDANGANRASQRPTFLERGGSSVIRDRGIRSAIESG